jgi:hypothetical protein
MQLQLHAHTSHTSHASHTRRTYTALIPVPSFASSQFAAHGHSDTATATPAAIRTFVVRFCNILGRRCLSCLHVARCPSHTCPCACRLWCAASFLLPPVAWAAWAAVLMKSSARARARTSSGNFHNFMVGNLRLTLPLRRAVDAGMFFARGSIPPPTHGNVCRTTTPRMVSMLFCPRTSRRSTTTLLRQAAPRFPTLTPGCPVVAANHHPDQHRHCMTFPLSLLPLRSCADSARLQELLAAVVKFVADYCAHYSAFAADDSRGHAASALFLRGISQDFDGQSLQVASPLQLERSLEHTLTLPSSTDLHHAYVVQQPPPGAAAQCPRRRCRQQQFQRSGQLLLHAQLRPARRPAAAAHAVLLLYRAHHA